MNKPAELEESIFGTLPDFENIDDVRTWFERERDNWKWIEELQRSAAQATRKVVPPSASTRKDIDLALSRFKAAVLDFLTTTLTPQGNATVEQAYKHLEARYVSSGRPQFVMSQSTLGRLIERLRVREGGEAALAALVTALGRPH